jgi:hypothetical protein
VVGAGRAVHPRQGKSLLAHERQEATLERAERDARIAAQDLAELRRAGRSRPTREDRGDVRWGRAVANAGLVAGSGEVVEGKVGGEVDERARHGGDRDAAVDRAVRRVDVPAPHGDARHAPLERRRHLGGRDRPLEEPEQVRRRAPAQARLAPASRTAARYRASMLGARWPTR